MWEIAAKLIAFGEVNLVKIRVSDTACMLFLLYRNFMRTFLFSTNMDQCKKFRLCKDLKKH